MPVLDQALLERMATKMGRTKKSLREQISREASRLGVDPRATQIAIAKDAKMGITRALHGLTAHQQSQVASAITARQGARSPSRETNSPDQESRASAASFDPIRVTVSTILSDPQLASRCMRDLRGRRHHDKAVREATIILEDRVRTLSRLGGMTGVPLMGRAFSPNGGALRVFADDEEQRGVMEVCQGIVRTFRNPAHHSLDDGWSQSDAIRFCAFIDLLLNMLGRAEQRAGN